MLWKPSLESCQAVALQAVAVEVLAGEMDQHFLAAVEDRLAERHRAELRIAARVVGDRHPVDARRSGPARVANARVCTAWPSAIVPRVVTNSTPSRKRFGSDSFSHSVCIEFTVPVLRTATQRCFFGKICGFCAAGTGWLPKKFCNCAGINLALIGSGIIPLVNVGQVVDSHDSHIFAQLRHSLLREFVD